MPTNHPRAGAIRASPDNLENALDDDDDDSDDWSEAVGERPGRAEARRLVMIFGLDAAENAHLCETLQAELTDCCIETHELRRPTLRQFKVPQNVRGGADRERARVAADATRAGPELIVLLHVVDGRTLLVDRDGLYNAFFREAAAATCGNVLLVLHGVETAESSVANEDALVELIDDGQASMWQLHKCGRFLTWDAAPSRLSLVHLQHALDSQLPPFVLTAGASRKTRASTAQRSCPRILIAFRKQVWPTASWTTRRSLRRRRVRSNRCASRQRARVAIWPRNPRSRSAR